MKEGSVKVPVGLHAEDDVEMELFTRQLLALRIRGQAERIRTSLLTREQAMRLRDALGEMIERLSPSAPSCPEEESALKLKAA
jgi:hypothetical protein